MHDIDTGGAYVRAITARECDRRVRAAFQALVLKIATRGTAIFDFGAGPGTDARFFAENGFTVGAYDVDPAMREYFAIQCRELIANGNIVPDGGDYPDFMARDGIGKGLHFSLITSNFAPLNLIENLHELFAKFHAITGPDSRVLASVLNPYFIGDWKYGWWRGNLLRLWRTGCYSVDGARGPIIRRRSSYFAAQCLPYFTLERVFRRTPLNQYMFLLFRKHA